VFSNPAIQFNRHIPELLDYFQGFNVELRAFGPMKHHMTQPRSIKMNKFTLYFAGSLEAEYLSQKNAETARSADVQSSLLAIVSFGFGVILPSIYFPEVLQEPGYLAGVSSAVLLPIFSIVISRIKGYVRAYEPINVLGGWLFDLFNASLLAFVPLPYVKSFVFLSLLKIILYAVATNLRLPAAVISAIGSAAIYFSTFYKLNAHPTILGGPYLALIIFVVTCCVVFVIVRGYEKLSRERFINQVLLEQEQRLTNRLLRGTLPEAIATKLAQSQDVIADYHGDAGVIFVDLVGFTSYSKELHPRQLVMTLNEIFTRFDKHAVQFGIEKIKTIGDAWMGASGLPEFSVDHAVKLMRFARALLQEVKRYREENGINLQVRIGIHSGPVVAGVIGKEKFAYDLWGHTVNLASRMTSTGTPDSIQVTEQFKKAVENEASFTGPFQVDAKGLGQINVWRKSS